MRNATNELQKRQHSNCREFTLICFFLGFQLKMKTQQVLFISVLSFSFNLMYFFLLFISFHRVQNLKDTIERLHGIPATKQVLMISGGEVLNPLKRVSSYPSGTDENPIYMFSILFDSSKLLQPWPSESRKFIILYFFSINSYFIIILRCYSFSFDPIFCPFIFIFIFFVPHASHFYEISVLKCQMSRQIYVFYYHIH